MESPVSTQIPTQLAPASTPTTVWFPPTATATRGSAVGRRSTPTPLQPQEHGEVIYSDDFSDPARWETGELLDGWVSAGVNELSLGVSRPRGFLFSRLSDFDARDFYLEVSANPTICRGKDEYGILLRLASPQDFFRFALTCDGHARLDRLLKGEASASVPPTLSAAVPPGAPSRSRLAVWVRGGEYRFIANGQLLFTIEDASLPQGGIGLFARAAGEDHVAVNFSELIIYSLLE